VHTGRPADVTLWTPALDRHQAIFGRAPDLAAGDRGFSSAANEQAAATRGVRRVILPRRGPKSTARRAYERQVWFRRGQRWRVGCEGRISVIKRRHGLRRCRYHGVDRMHRWVGLGVIAVSSAISAVAPDFAVIALAQLGIGIGVGLSYTAAIAAVADWTTPADRSGVLAIALLGPPIAWIVGMPLSGIVGEASSPGSRRLSCSRSLRWRFSLAECLCHLRRDGRTFA